MKQTGRTGTRTNGMTDTKPRAQRTARLARSLGIGLGFMACVGFVVYSTFADPPPVLTIAPQGGSQYSIIVTNATSPTNYTLFWRPSLTDSNYPWQVVGYGGIGETNLTVDAGVWPVGFFKVLVGGDQDGDLVPEWMDAQPQNPAVGALTVTIDSPLNGTTLN